MNVVMKSYNEEKAQKKLTDGYVKAEKILNSEEKMERFLQRLEKKLRVIPVAGNTLANVPAMVSLIKSYIKKEYSDIPLGTIIAIISALAYFLSPIDAIPDVLPIFGFVDDAGVVGVCLKLVNSDIEEYQKWRKNNNKILDI